MSGPRRNKISKDKWYRYDTGNRVFYSFYGPYEDKTLYHGDGSTAPTPKECKALIDGIEGPKDPVFSPQGLLHTSILDRSKEVNLPPGTYKFISDYGSPGERLTPFDLRDDQFVRIGKNYNSIVEEIRSFIRDEDKYRKFKTIYKRGLLFYGPAGTGKTAAIRSVLREEIPKDSIIMFFEKKIPEVDFIKHIQATLSDTFKVLIFEEITEFTESSGGMGDLLTFIDGEMSLDKCLIIATTNYPEKLPANIVDRRSRFDVCYKIGNPDAEERHALLLSYLEREPTPEEVKITDKHSAADIKELALLYHLRGASLADTIANMKKHKDLIKADFMEREKMGL